MASGHGSTERSPLLQPSSSIDNAGTITATDPSTPTITVDNTDGGDEIAYRSDTNNSGHGPHPQGINKDEYRKQLVYIVPAVSLGIFLAALDSTIIVSSYAAIGSDLHALNLTSWIASSYFLTLTSFQPLYGKLSNIFGRKACLLFSYTIFGVGTLWCGLSRNIYSLIAARIFQGIGGGGMTTIVSILFGDLVPLKERGVWQGITNIVWATGSASGASLGGIIADAIGWRWAFLIQTPICLLAIISVTVFLKLPPLKEENTLKKLGRVDFLGAITLVFAVFCLLLGMDRGSNISWRTPWSYGPLIASLVLLLAFAYIEGFVAKEPFAPGRIIFERSVIASYLCYLFSFGAWLSVLYYTPLYYQAVEGHTATGAAVRLLPAILASVSGSLCGGLLMKWTGRYYWLTVISYTGLSLGIVPILLFSGLIVKSTWGISVGLFIGAFGNGIGMTSALTALIANSTVEEQSIAIACSYLFRSLGPTIGVSLSSTIIQQSLRSTLKKHLGSGRDAIEIEKGARENLKFINGLDPKVQAIVRRAYGIAIRHGYILMIGMASGALLASLFLREKKLANR